MTIFDLNLFGIHIAPSYYGLMYVLGFLIGYFYIYKTKILDETQLENLFLFVFFGVVFGGRIGYILFYDLSFYLQNPLKIFYVWQGGMSFHGGFLGVLIGVFCFCKIYKINFWKIMDELAIVSSIGIFFGRIGNYLNKELLGFSGYNGFLAVEKGGNYYFPSPLLEAFLEGIVLFLILYFFNKNKKFLGLTSCLFLIFYGTFRIFVEIFFRTPDVQIGYIFGFLTMGIILSLPMIFLGIFLFFYLKK